MTCSDDDWHALWSAVNSGRGDVVEVPRAALNAVFECVGRVPDGVALKVHRTTMDCDRAKLKAMLQEHGRTCGRAT